jgi:polysaccharide biosynthesis transport protein
MKLKRAILIVGAWIGLSLVAGLIVYFFIEKRYTSLCEVALDTEALSSEGLAKFDKVNLADSVEVELVQELLKNPDVTGYAATKLGRYTQKEVESNLKIKNKEGSPVVVFKIGGKSPADAVALAKALVEKSIEMEVKRKEHRMKEAVASAAQRLKDVERDVDALNGRILDYNTEKGVTLSSSTERQQMAVQQLVEYELRLATLTVEKASMENRIKLVDELISTLSSRGTLPSGFEFEDLEKNYTIAEARKKLLDQQAELASTQSRYGSKHPKVQAAEAEVNSTKKTLLEILKTQRERMNAQLADNAHTTKIVQEQVAATESQAKQTDLALDPQYAKLTAQRDALNKSYSLLSARLSELMVYEKANLPGFYLFSEPVRPTHPSLLQFATVLAISLVAGGFFGVCHGFWRLVVKEETVEESAEGVYAQR